jgi:hypothetical protein
MAKASTKKKEVTGWVYAYEGSFSANDFFTSKVIAADYKSQYVGYDLVKVALKIVTK